ncbi:hypothetical protein KZ829_20565 [Actinoplanes hulinensis]|uniref:Uncharacterized protein n=1 Tax=Actinoplanes hulinensis TaxID=1144547 RepID=A0ABS7B524_9ACTN|nr:hypothetical protein [Actinoplanes hulinensis]MBW6436135.1 hypothetical protein [Actinoplanes hulinensis]
MEGIPQNVSEAVRVAAHAARGYPGDLADIHRRARRRRNRRAAVSAAAVVAVLAGAVAGVAIQRQPGPSTGTGVLAPASSAEPGVSPDAPISSGPGAEPPGQHLLLPAAAGDYRGSGGTTVRLGGETAVGELLPDGNLIGHPVVGARNWERVVVLPSGGVVAFGSHDTQPGTKREDGPNVPGLEYRLVGTDPDGRVRVQRNVRKKGEPVMLLTAREDVAYLWRPAGLFMHSMATGHEELIAGRPAFGLGQVYGDLRHSDMSGGWVAVSRMRDECVPRVYDITGVDLVAEIPLTASGCIAVTDMRLSPDSRTLAVAYDRDTGAGLRPVVALIRVTDGKVLKEQELADVSGKTSPMISIAWPDSRTLRGAVYPVGAAGVSEVTGFTVTID